MGVNQEQGDVPEQLFLKRAVAFGFVIISD